MEIFGSGRWSGLPWMPRSHSPPPCRETYQITVDEGGVFHLRPNCGGPFRSFVEATTAIRLKHFLGPPSVVRVRTYGKTVKFVVGFPNRPRNMYSLTIDSGMFNVHPPDVGGPFKSLSDAMAAIELHTRPPLIPQLPKEYFTIKDGLFHIYPFALGGPFSRFGDALAALNGDSLKPPPFDWWKDAEVKARRMHKWLKELDDDDFYRPVTTPPISEPRKCPEEDPDSSIVDSEPEICDPVVLEALQYVARLEAEEEAVRDGMMWMENDATQAFKAYLSSTETEDMKGVKYVFHKLDYQCLIYDGPKIYHHYNFTMKTKLRSKKRWDYKSFFAEVKSTANGKQYFCCPLQDTDDGHCVGCRNTGIKLIHPATGGYEEGNEGAGFPFDTVGGI